MGAILQYLEAFMRYAYVTKFDFWAEENYVKNLVSKFFGVKCGCDVVGDERNTERTEMRYLREALKEVVLAIINIAITMQQFHVDEVRNIRQRVILGTLTQSL